MLFIFSVCEIVTFPKLQQRTFSEVCANDHLYENSIFEYEDIWNVQDDSDDGYNITALISTANDSTNCNYHLKMPQNLKDRTLAYFNRIRWLTGYERNLTWRDDMDEETCQCSFVQFASGGSLGHGVRDGRCMDEAPLWRIGCQDSNIGTFPHKKMSNGIRNLYDEGLLDVGHRNIMLSPLYESTSMCTTSSGKMDPDTFQIYYDFFTMNIWRNESLAEWLPFIASPPPGYIPYYMMPSIVSLLAKDIKNPVASEFKVYYNGRLVHGKNQTIYSSLDGIYGYSLNTYPDISTTYEHLTNTETGGALFKPGSVFGFEATNNGKTYAWNTTLVDCAHDTASMYPDPAPAPTQTPAPQSNPTEAPSNPSTDSPASPATGTATENQPSTEATQSPESGSGHDETPAGQKSGLSQKQKVGIGVGVTVGVVVVAAAVVGGLFFAGVIGGGAAAGGAAAAGASAAGASVVAV